MNKNHLPPVNILSVFQHLSRSRLNPAMTWSQSASGWKRILAYHPSETFIHYCGDKKNKVKEFYEKHTGKLFVGYISYDMGRELLGVASRHSAIKTPDICFSVYDNWIEFRDDATIIHSDDKHFIKELEDIITDLKPMSAQDEPIDLIPKLDRQKYGKRFKNIIQYILHGDIYQVNFTHQLVGTTDRKPEELFLYLLKKNPVDFATFIPLDNGAVLSLSPERFIKIENRRISTEPIKGTRPRSDQFDERMKQDLLESRKEEAELFMITDLLRNDLGKICEIGTVQVTEKKGLKKLPSVWHTFSTVSGMLRKDVSPMDALLSMSPGGSITGCPKKRAVEIIDELEQERRGVYTGSIGVIYPNGDLDMNIAIRTVMQEGNKISLGIGGGITLDSNEEDEYQETFAKASSFTSEINR